VKRVAKYLSIAALVLVFLLTAGGWFVNRWLQSAEAHAGVEGKISEALHLPVKIETIGFSVWSGLTAKKISVTGPDGILFEAAGISASHRFSSLLRGSLVFGEVRIEQPHLRLTEDAFGKWTLPHSFTAQQSGAATIALPQPQSANNTAVSPAKVNRISIGKIVVEGGRAELIDKACAPFATIRGLNVTLREVTESGFSGNFFAERVTFHGWIAFDHLNGLATRTGQGLQIRKLAAEAGGGSVTGEATWTEGAAGTATLNLSGINLARATQDGGMSLQKITGMLSGEAQFAGLGADTKKITGKGALLLKNGNCTQIEALRQIGDALRLASLANFEIADATAKFQVAGEQFSLAPMDVSAPPVGLTFNGSVAFDGTLNVAGLLRAPADLVERQGMVAAKFSPPDAFNRRSLPFSITGSLMKPKQNLAESLTGTKDRKQQRIIAAESILSALIERKKPKPVQPGPVPQPAAARQ